MKKIQKIYSIIILIILAVLFISLYTYQDKIKSLVFNSPNAIANPASKYCLNKGGKLEINKRGDGSEYGICFFEDNRQCEEWSLYRGECPVGGLKITGYITKAAVYCVILGGKYEITNNGELEDGTCSFFNGNVCDVWDLYNGKCEKGEINPIIYENGDYNFSLKLPRTWENKYKVNNENGNNGIKYVSFDYETANLFKIAVVPFLYWEKNTNLGDYLGRNNSSAFAVVYSTDPIKQNKPQGEEYIKLVSDVKNIKDTFKITKPYIFFEKNDESGSNYSINVMSPYVAEVENSGNANIAIGDFIGSIVSEFKKTVSTSDAWQGENTLRVFYELYELNGEYMSIRFETEKYTGGAQPENISYSFNYDFKKGQIITLSDIFNDQKDYIKTISAKSIDYIIKINKKDPFTDEEWIKEGAGPKEGNFKTFTFNNETIVFYLNPYQVGPYAAGRQDVVMPFSSLKDILNSQFVSDFNLKI